LICFPSFCTAATVTFSNHRCFGERELIPASCADNISTLDRYGRSRVRHVQTDSRPHNYTTIRVCTTHDFGLQLDSITDRSKAQCRDTTIYATCKSKHCTMEIASVAMCRAVTDGAPRRCQCLKFELPSADAATSQGTKCALLTTSIRLLMYTLRL